MLDTIVGFLGTYPEALDALKDVDAELMVAEVEAAPGRNRVAAARSPDYFTPNRQKEARESSARQALAFASALLRSGRAADATRVVHSAAVLGSCEELVAVSGRYKDTHLLVEEQCRAVEGCLPGGSAVGPP